MHTKHTFNKIIKWFFIGEINDERIRDEHAMLSSNAYKYILVLSFFSIIVKQFILNYNFYSYALELIGILASFILLGIFSIYYKLPLLKATDDHLLKLQYKSRSVAFKFLLLFYIFGDFIGILFFSDLMNYPALIIRLLIWIIIIFPLNNKIIKNGLLTHGSGKQRVKSIKSMQYSYIIGGIFFGIFMSRNSFFSSDPNYLAGIISTLVYGSIWGVLSYILMKRQYKASEINTDKLLEDIDEE